MKHRMTRTRRVGRLPALARTTGAIVSLALLPLVALPRPPEAGADSEVVVTIDRVIGTGTDDAEQRMSKRSVALTSSDLELSTDGTTVQTVGLRFTNITVPPGAAITRAWVQFRVDEVSTRAASLTIAGQAADYPRTFADAQGNISSRARTTATVRWIPPSWPKVGAAGPDQRTPDLSPVIGEIVGRPGWVPGHALALIITGTGRRTAEAFDGTAPPVLHLEYRTSAPQPEEPPATDLPPRVPSGGVPTPADYGFPSCTGPGRTVVRPFPAGTNRSSPWRVDAPTDDTTYDLTGVTSTAQPSSSYPFGFGLGDDGGDSALRTCFMGGELRDRFGDPPDIDWRTAHDTYNAACVKGVGVDWYQILNTVCRGIQDGFRPQEDQSGSTVTPNNARFMISDTYLANIMDDCIENDYITEGVILDSLWDGCHTGISERPSSDRCWVTPPREQLIVDHLLLRLRPYELDEGFGYGRLFKFAKCAEDGAPRTHNDLVLRCSTFLVPDYRLDGGTRGMEVPVGTTVDDSDCPGDPTTIVWLGGGSTYPGNLRGLPIRTLSGAAGKQYWDAKVAEWWSRH